MGTFLKNWLAWIHKILSQLCPKLMVNSRLSFLQLNLVLQANKMASCLSLPDLLLGLLAKFQKLVVPPPEKKTKKKSKNPHTCHLRWDCDKWVWDSDIQPNQGARTVTVRRDVLHVRRSQWLVLYSFKLWTWQNSRRRVSIRRESTCEEASDWLPVHSKVTCCEFRTRQGIWNQRVEKNFVIPSKHSDPSGHCVRVDVRFSGG